MYKSQYFAHFRSAEELNDYLTFVGKHTPFEEHEELFVFVRIGGELVLPDGVAEYIVDEESSFADHPTNSIETMREVVGESHLSSTISGVIASILSSQPLLDYPIYARLLVGTPDGLKTLDEDIAPLVDAAMIGR